jgi:predicted ATPase
MARSGTCDLGVDAGRVGDFRALRNCGLATCQARGGPGLLASGSRSGTDVLARSSLLDWGNLGPFNDLLAEWQSRFYHFHALRMGTNRAQSLASSKKLEPTGSNLAAVLLHLATDRRAVFEKLQALITEIVPDTGLLQVRTGGNPGSTGSLRVAFEGSSGVI